MGLAEVGEDRRRVRHGALHEPARLVGSARHLAAVEVHRQCDVALAGEPAGHGADVVVEPPPLVDHQDPCRPLRARRRARQEPPQRDAVLLAVDDLALAHRRRRGGSARVVRDGSVLRVLALHRLRMGFVAVGDGHGGGCDAEERHEQARREEAPHAATSGSGRRRRPPRRTKV